MTLDLNTPCFKNSMMKKCMSWRLFLLVACCVCSCNPVVLVPVYQHWELAFAGHLPCHGPAMVQGEGVVVKYEKRVEPGCISVDGWIGKKLLICKCKQHGDKDSSALGEENCGVETNYGFLLFSCLLVFKDYRKETRYYCAEEWVQCREERLCHEYTFGGRSILNSLGTADLLEDWTISPAWL